MNPMPVIRMLNTAASIQSGDVLVPFSIDEAYARLAARETEPVPPLVHLWRHRRAMVLGARDAKLPNAALAVRLLRERGCQTAVRHSGGAAVPLDGGVVNLSLVMPAPAHDLTPEPHFERMAALIREALGTTGKRVQTGEVEGAYCPGSYDLSIDGFKFCGIAQRRLTRAVIVQAFVLTEGSGRTYGEAARDFYRMAGEGAPAGAFPRVVPERMASLSELGVRGGAGAFAGRVRDVLAGLGTVEEMNACPASLEADAKRSLAALRARNGSVGLT
jgi:octanoyl-[GcvH]:protein N-octanoyltransferase